VLQCIVCVIYVRSPLGGVVRCSVLQCVLMCCAVCSSVLQRIVVYCSVFQCAESVAVCCSVVRCCAECCSVVWSLSVSSSSIVFEQPVLLQVLLHILQTPCTNNIYLIFLFSFLSYFLFYFPFIFPVFLPCILWRRARTQDYFVHVSATLRVTICVSVRIRDTARARVTVNDCVYVFMYGVSVYAVPTCNPKQGHICMKWLAATGIISV